MIIKYTTLYEYDLRIRISAFVLERGKRLLNSQFNSLPGKVLKYYFYEFTINRIIVLRSTHLTNLIFIIVE